MRRNRAWSFSVFLVLFLAGLAGFLLSSPEKQPRREETDNTDLLFGPEYPEKLTELIRAAQKRVYVAMYVAGYSPSRSWAVENSILNELARAWKRGVDVRVLLDDSLEWNPKSRRLDGPRSKKNDQAYN